MRRPKKAVIKKQTCFKNTPLGLVLLVIVLWGCLFSPGISKGKPIPPAVLSLLLLNSHPLPKVPIVFASRNRMANWWNVHVGPPLDVAARELKPGGRLMLWKPDGSVTSLTDGSYIYDAQQPDVSFDGTKIVFSAVTWAGGQWRLYEINVDGSGLRQLTFDDRNIPIPEDPRRPGYNQWQFGEYGDFGPTYLPDGRIMFTSTRYMTLASSCGHRGQNLYVLDPVTLDYHRRTTLRAGAIDPIVLKSGRVMYSHWIDAMSKPATDGPGLRPLEQFYNFAPSSWGIWSMYPDGSDAGRYAFLQGGILDGGGAYQPHELPDGDIVTTVRGSAALLGDTLANAVTIVKPGFVDPQKLKFLGNPVGPEGPHALGPAPLPGGGIVVSYTENANVEWDALGLPSATYDFGLYVTDRSLSGVTKIYNDPLYDELDPAVVTTRTAQVVPDGPGADLVTDDPTQNLGTTATLVSHGVYKDLPLDVLDVPSPRVGTVAWVDVYDESQTFTTSEEFPELTKQMPRLLGSYPVNPDGSFTVTVPADRTVLYVLVNQDGIAVRSGLSKAWDEDPGGSVDHSWNGHDFLRPNTAFHCTGCHVGHMMPAQEAMAARPNLARLAEASASTTADSFWLGAWRVNDLRKSVKEGAYGWATWEGNGAWVQLDWPMEVQVDKIVLYPFAFEGCLVNEATVELSDGAKYPIGPLVNDGSRVTVDLGGLHTVTWLRFTVDVCMNNIAALGELVVNGPEESVTMPDIAPPTPVALTATDGALYLTWQRTETYRDNPHIAGYRLYYGTAPENYTGMVDAGNVTSFYFRDILEDGKEYFIAAKSYNTHGTESAAFSNEVSATVHNPVVLSVDPDHGPVGGNTEITITGDYFSPMGVRVFMDGHYCHVVERVDEQTIKALTHYHEEGTVDVEVWNPNDGKGVLENGFTYDQIEATGEAATE